MLSYYLILCATTAVLASSQYNDGTTNNDYNKINDIKANGDWPDQESASKAQKVDLKLYYESLCPDCIKFDPEFVRVAARLRQYVNVHTYPYGNAYMTTNPDGSVTVECQHGEPECYGNKLHACAIDILADVIPSLKYNACMMGRRSNDTAAEQCGEDMRIPSAKVASIKTCAKGSRGQELLVQYGKDSEVVNFKYVPYVMLNGAEWNGEEADFMKDVCAAFADPPAPCLKNW